MEDESLDLLVVDFLESPEAERVEPSERAWPRSAAAATCCSTTPTAGYAPAHELLAGWRERRFTGVKDEWPEACETAIFRSE